MKILAISMYTRLDKDISDTTSVRELVHNMSKLNEVVLIAPSKGKDKIGSAKVVKIRSFNLWYFGIIFTWFYTLLVALWTALRFKPNVIYERVDIFGVGFILKKLFRVSLVLESNIFPEDLPSIGPSHWKTRFLSIIQEVSFSRANKIVAVSQNMVKEINKRYKIGEEKIIVISKGANIDLFKPMEIKGAKTKLGLSLQEQYVCFVGQFFSWQGLDFLIKSAPLILEECPSACFLTIGDGEMKEELIALTKKLDIADRFIFTGIVPYERIPLYINASDVCVAPFIKERNERTGISPLKIYEYAACGKAVVTSRLSDLEFAEENNIGILVEPENPQALAEAIIKLLKDKELREKIGKNGRDYVIKNHSWEKVAREAMKVCEEMTKNNSVNNRVGY